MLTACTKDCPDCCSIIIKKHNGKIKIIGNPDHPITKGFTCAKVRKHINRLKSPNRITNPMLKSEDGFKTISWERALDIFSEKISLLLKDDPKKILHIQGHGARGVTKVVTDNFFTFLGCTKTNGSLCDSSGIEACIDDFGTLDHNYIDDLLNSSHIINFGKDFSSSSIHLSHIIRKARQKNIHVTSIWPGGGDYDKYADKLIKINPGTDRFLAIAIIKCLIKSNCLDNSYVEKCTRGKKYFNLVNKSSLKFLSEQCSISIKDIEFLADIYSKNKVSTIIGWGVQRYLFGKETVRHINALSWLSGNVGYTGAGVYFSISSIRSLNLDWINQKSNRSFLEPVLAQEIKQSNPKIEAVIINCSNIVNQAPDSRYTKKILENIKFNVVIDAFMTDTAVTADLILPCTLMWEEDDMVGSMMHDYLQYAKKVFAPPEGCKSDFTIVKELNKKLNTGFSLPDREDCFKLSFPESDAEVSYETFKNNGFAFTGKHEPVYKNGTKHDSGKFSLINTLSAEPEKNPDFPMRLLSLINKDFIHSQIMPEEQGDIPFVTVNPDTEYLKEIDLNKKIYLATSLGKLEVKIKFDKSLHPDIIVYQRGDWMLYKGGINSIIEAKLTDSRTGAAYYAQQAKLENP